MRYIEIKIEINSEFVEPAIAKLMELGFDSFQIDDPSEFASIIENLDDTEWYDKEQVSEDFLQDENPDNLARITIYCDDDAEGRANLEVIRSAFDVPEDSGENRYGNKGVKVVSTVQDDSEWMDKWKEYYHPTRVSERIIVTPTWAAEAEIDEAARDSTWAAEAEIDEAARDSTWAAEAEVDEMCGGAKSSGTPNAADILIRLDPGMAFGTGTHETTALALRMLEKYVTVFELNARDSSGCVSVLDVGTGSGILAIAAAKLGATDILAIDIDEDAVRVAKENIEYNIDSGSTATCDACDAGNACVSGDACDVGNAGVSGDACDVGNASAAGNAGDKLRIDVRVGDLTKGVDFSADIVVANLLADLIMAFSGDAIKHLLPGGVFIASGILIEKRDSVLKAMRDAGFDTDNADIASQGEWCAITVRKMIGCEKNVKR